MIYTGGEFTPSKQYSTDEGLSLSHHCTEDRNNNNNSGTIVVCQIALSSTCHDDINAKIIQDYNKQLTKWDNTNGRKVMQTVSTTFKLGTGELAG